MAEHDKIILGENQYGKAEVRVVKVTRETARHEIEDLNITSQLRGDFSAVHLYGDNANCLTTDAQKKYRLRLCPRWCEIPRSFFIASGPPFQQQLSGGIRRALGGRAICMATYSG